MGFVLGPAVLSLDRQALYLDCRTFRLGPKKLEESSHQSSFATPNSCPNQLLFFSQVDWCHKNVKTKNQRKLELYRVIDDGPVGSIHGDWNEDDEHEDCGHNTVIMGDQRLCVGKLIKGVIQEYPNKESRNTKL